MLRNIYLWCCIVLVINLIACASQGTLTGGEKDTRPPQLDSTKTTPNLQVKFQKQDIILTFDEWIKLEDIVNQIVISPPIDPKPTISLKKKTVFIEFQPAVVLKEAVTYTINFGSAVKDFTEGNVPEDLRFVFSTGDYIDSLTVEGSVQEVLKKEPVKDVLVMLYDNTADSVVRKERPFYFAKTDKEGKFLIRNVRADTFKVFALEDKNLNYKFDAANERIAFLDTLLIVNDTSKNQLNLLIFEEEADLKVKSIDKKNYGVANIAFNRKPEGLSFRFEPSISTLLFDYEKDSLRVWYELDTIDTWQLVVSQDTIWRDTIALDTSGRATRLQKGQLTNNTTPNILPQHPKMPFSLEFNHPIQSIDSTLISLYEDSTRNLVIPSLEIDAKRARKVLYLNYTWKSDKLYEMVLLPNAVKDIFGLTNKDTIIQLLTIRSLSDYGNIVLSLSALDSTQQYVVQLHEGDNNLQYQFLVRDTSTWNYQLQYLKPANYTLHFILDDNRNERWDSGNYDKKSQPEVIFIRKLDALRANWDLEVEVKGDEIRKN